MKKNPFRPFAIGIGLLVCGLAGFRVWQLWQQPLDGFWTQPAYSPALDAVADSVVVYVAGDPILKVVEAQNLVLKRGKDTEAPVAAAELKASVNNYYKARAGRIPMMVTFAAVSGAGLAFFLVGLFMPLIRSFHPQELVDLHLET